MKETLEMALEALTNPSTIAVQHAIELIRAELAKPEPNKPCKCLDEFWCATFDKCKRTETVLPTVKEL